jgi:hypothetical protein
MGLALQEDLVALHSSVPTETDGLGTLGLLKATLVQLPCIGVVIINGRNRSNLLLELLVGIEDQDRQVLQDDQLQLGDVIRVNPVFGCLTNKVLLASTSGRIAFDWVTFGTDKVIQLGEIDNEGIVVVLEERLGIETGSKDRLKVPLRLFLFLGG